ncbi:MAG TPA: hypothetical protein PKD05_12870, partial [Candidatus Melainabacteria bacterium]|nr:hypothetical protein [Candidatus Melainabacteria bacterium]
QRGRHYRRAHDGNEADGSIWCNLPDMPTVAEVFKILSAIRSKEEVADIRVEVTTFDDPDWPFSDSVWVITSADAETVKSWFSEDRAPDYVTVGWREDSIFEPVEVPQGMHPVLCWWD